MASLDRTRDRAMSKPVEMRHAAGDRPGFGEALPLMLQQLALQSTYWLLPVIVAAFFGFGPAAAAGFLSASLLITAMGALMQGWTRGWLGSGYALPFVPSPAFVAVYAGAAAAGAGLGAAGAALIAASLSVSLLFLAFPRFLQLISAEITGVVAFSIGLGFMPKIIELLNLALDPGKLPAQLSERMSDAVVSTQASEIHSIAVFAVTLAAVVFVGIARWRFAAYAIIAGAATGSIFGLLLIGPDAVALRALHSASWLALPSFTAPDFAGVSAALLATAVVTVLCNTADQLGDVLVAQREQDAAWTKPDPPPLRRGVLASNLVVTLGGLTGGMAASTSSACVALSIATRSFSRWTACAGACLLVLLSCSPKFVSLFILIPGPVVAALLIYISGFMMSSGAKLITGRVLDARRSACVGFGLACGIASLFAQDFLLRYLPEALVSPVVLSFLAAFALHLATLPLVKEIATAEIDLEGNVGQAADAFAESSAGNWALRRETADGLRHAVLETAELLAARGAKMLKVSASLSDGNVLLSVEHAAPILPAPSIIPNVEDLEDASRAEAFTMWMATRGASDYTRKISGQQASATFAFQE